MTPEEEEIQKRTQALQSAETALVQAEADYAEYRLQLKAFEQAYILAVQDEQWAIEKWESLIAQQLSRIQFLLAVQDGLEPCPSSPYVSFAVENMTPSSSTEDLDLDEPIISEVETSSEIKSLYRELARRYHPDLAENPEVRKQRASVMQEINTAYQQRDLDVLQQISNRPSIVDPINDSLGDQLVWIIRREAEVGLLVQAAIDKLAASKSSPLGELMSYCANRTEENRFVDVKRALNCQAQQLREEWGFHCQHECDLWQAIL